MANEFVARLGLVSRQDSQITGSLRITGSVEIVGNTRITASLFQVSSASVTSLIVSSSAAQTNVGINSPTFDTTNPESFLVSGSNINVIAGEASINTYAQLNIVNLSNGAQASADIVATNNTGTENGNFVNLGINGSNYSPSLGSANEAYLFNTGSNLLIGNTTLGANSNIRFFSGNSGTSFAMTITGSVVVIPSGSLSGSLLGTASYVSGSVFTSANPALTASYALNGGVTQIVAGTNVTLSPTNGLGAVTVNATAGSSFPASGSSQFTGSVGITGSLVISGTLPVELFVVGGSQLTGSTRITGSLDVFGPTAITGSVIVSGANGAGVFSQGALLSDYIGGLTTTASYMVWRAPYSCSVVAIYGYREGGGPAKVNAVRSGSSGFGLISGSDLSIAVTNVWTAFNATLQNTTFNTGDSLKVILSGSASNNQLGVQVDFIRKF